jgi:hypothetical protein
MYNKVKRRLLEVLSNCDNHTGAILGDELYYELDGEMKIDAMKGFGDFLTDILMDASFKTEMENMHLFITLA